MMYSQNNTLVGKRVSRAGSIHDVNAVQAGVPAPSAEGATPPRVFPPHKAVTAPQVYERSAGANPATLPPAPPAPVMMPPPPPQMMYMAPPPPVATLFSPIPPPPPNHQPYKMQVVQPMQQPVMYGGFSAQKAHVNGGEVGYGGVEIPPLCSCFDDCDACLIAWLVPCAVTGRIYEAVGDSYKKGMCLYCCCQNFCGSLCTACFHGCVASKKLYEAYPKPGGNDAPCKLCLCHYCSWTSVCTKTQELRYMKNLRKAGLLRGDMSGRRGQQPGPVRQAMGQVAGGPIVIRT